MDTVRLAQSQHGGMQTLSGTSSAVVSLHSLARPRESHSRNVRAGRWLTSDCSPPIKGGAFPEAKDRRTITVLGNEEIQPCSQRLSRACH